MEIVNFVILLGKWFINKWRTDNKELYLFDFLDSITAKN